MVEDLGQEIEISVVVPLYNEQANLPHLMERLSRVLKKTGRSYEIVLVDDGSQDQTPELLLSFYKANPKHLCIVTLQGNHGQHRAILAGFYHAKGRIVFTMDGDLQNPPEELPKILAKMDEGHDYVGSYRLKRNDHWFRTYASRCVNRVRECVTNISMKDHGCMLRAYSRTIVDLVLENCEISTLIPVLAYTFACNPAEVGIEHVSRENDQSKYNWYKLLRLNFDLFTSFSLVPLQIFTVMGLGVALCSGLLGVYLVFRRFMWGAEADGVFTLFMVLFFLISIVIVGIGILGEYIGRIYEVVRKRPRFTVSRVLDSWKDNPQNIAHKEPKALKGLKKVSEKKQVILKPKV
jgi:undecaprenyl-phosphate 4-deoxy-4-formamido-L-arabinose transferase